MKCQGKQQHRIQESEQNDEKSSNAKTQRAVKASSIVKKHLAQSQKRASLRPQARLRSILSSPPRIAKQRLKRGDRIDVFWDCQSSYFRGTVIGKYEKCFIIQYDDGTELKHDLNNFKWRFVLINEAGTESVSDSMDLNFEPDELDSSQIEFADAVDLKRGRRPVGEPSREAIESGIFLPPQVCKRLPRVYAKLKKMRNR